MAQRQHPDRSIAGRNGDHERERVQRLKLSSLAIVVVVSLLSTILPVPEGARAVETETFRLEPHPLRVNGYERRSFAFDIEPGTRVTDAVRVTNKTDSPRRFRLNGADAERDPETGALSVSSRGQEATGMGAWIDLETTELQLEPRASQVVGFEFARPEGRSTSGYGAIVVEELRDAQGAGVDVIHRLAILVELGGRSPDIVVQPPALDVPVQLVPASAEISTSIRNDTLGRVNAEVRFSVSGLTGRIWPLEPTSVLLEPGEERLVTGTWNNVPRWGGLVRPEVDITWQRGSVVLQGDRKLYPPLWLLALIIVAVGIRGLREIRTRRQQRPTGQPGAASDLVHSTAVDPKRH